MNGNPLTLADALFMLCMFGGIGLTAIGLAIGAWIMAKAEQIRRGTKK